MLQILGGMEFRSYYLSGLAARSTFTEFRIDSNMHQREFINSVLERGVSASVNRRPLVTIRAVVKGSPNLLMQPRDI